MSGAKESAAVPRDARSSLGKRSQWLAAVYGIFALMLAGGAVSGAFGEDRSVFLGVAVGLGVIIWLTLWRSRRNRVLGAAVNAINLAFADFVAGRQAEGEARLDALSAAAARFSYIRRTVEMQRTGLAIRRGQLEEAAGWATKVQEGSVSWTSKLTETMQKVEARALRALVYASLGRADEALADAKVVESSPLVSAAAAARISLSRAVTLARSARLEELQAHFTAEGESLVEELSTRERMLSRALRRLGQPRARSVYREAATRDERDEPVGSEEGEAARAWVRKIAPDAARFVPQIPRSEAAEHAPPYERPAPPVDRRSQAAKAAQVAAFASVEQRSSPWHFRPILGWLGAAVMFGLLWIFFEQWSQGTGDSSGSSTLAAPLMFGGVLVAVVAAIIAVRRIKQRRWVTTLQRAQLQLARGDDPQALATLDEVARTGGVGFGPPSYLAVARHALRRGDTAAALLATVRGMGLARTSLQSRAAHQDLVLPELIALHAFASATDGKQEDAEADLDLLEREYPTFPFRARAAYRVNLLGAIRRGDLPAAARIVATREPEMSVDLRVDLLGEVASAAAAGGLHDEAAEALHSELSAMPRAASWIEQVAPGLTARIGRAHAVRVATPFMSYDDDTRPLGEEAAQLLALGARRPRS